MDKDKDISSRYAKGLPFALLIGAAVFFVAGPWVVDRLFDYGFSFSSNAWQDLAWLVAGLMSLPTSLIVDPSQPSRLLMAINGAIWGGILYSLGMLVAFVRQGKRSS
jgi:hypothetical protein